MSSVDDAADVTPGDTLDSARAFLGGASMRGVHAVIERVARTDATVLIWGESGVGKEVVARALHVRSLRRERPFVKVNCAALPSELLESELFGYERGAFTGAHRAKPGKFEIADTGTIFLDEIGEMPLPLQAKLLHVLQDGQFSRLGSRRDVRVDVRIVVATNRDLAALAAQGAFRTDLYYRLNVVAIHVPPLRERREEIPVLTQRFLDQYARRYGRPRPSLSAATLRAFMEYPWPGNIRELENVVKRIVVLGDENLAMADFLHAWDPRATGATPQPGPSDAGRAAPGPPARRGFLGPGGTHAGNGGRAGGGPGEDPGAGAPPQPGGDQAPADQQPEVEELGLREFARRAAGRAERRALEDVLVRARWRKREAARRLRISTKTLLRKMREYGLGA